MRHHERIPLHDHSNLDTGGLVAAATVVQLSGGGSTDTSGSGITIADGTYELAIEGGQSVIFAHGAMGAAETFDPTDGNVHTGTLDAACTFTLNAPAGTGACTLELRLAQDGTGGWPITWPGSVTVVGTLDTTASTTSIVILETLDGGASWVAVVVGGGSTVAALDDLTDVTITAVADGDVLTYDSGTAAWVNAAPATGTTGGVLLITDSHSTPIVFADLILNEAGDDFLYEG